MRLGAAGSDFAYQPIALRSLACTTAGGAADTEQSERTTMAAERLYAQTNSPDENEIVVFDRTAEGTLLPVGRFRTDGFGTGVDIGPPPVEGAVNSQGSLALSEDRRYLFTVNVGSNDISSFAVVPSGLRFVGKVPSGGAGPVSVAVRGALLYVANKFGSGGIAGFRIERNGLLSPLSGSQQQLSADGAAPAQVSFTPDGKYLVVTELATERIVTYRVRQDRRPGEPRSIQSSGQTPFGFGFDPQGRLIVSEAFRDAPQGSAVSSYRLSSSGAPVVISGSVATHQTSACWIATTPDGRYTYTSNTLSGSISGYRIQAGGQLELLDADGRTGVTGEGSRPADMVISRDGRQLYVVNPGSQTVGAFAIQADGGLAPLPYAGGIPSGAVGLVGG